MYKAKTESLEEQIYDLKKMNNDLKEKLDVRNGMSKIITT